MNRSPYISIIIPVINEAAIIEATLERLAGNLDVEVIVVDGGSEDNTVSIAQQKRVKVINNIQSGRASQMNAGAAVAKGKILLFLHADTKLPDNYDKLVRTTLKQPQVVAGAFKLKIEGQAKTLRFIETMVQVRSSLFSLPYGDQALFIDRDIFNSVGGFASLPIMEDFELVQRLKRIGKIAIASAAVITSNRRWSKLGVWQTTFINQLIILGYYLKIPPEQLSKFYRDRGNKNYK
jgi:rSAM/selenodomain-associated transferase 2